MRAPWLKKSHTSREPWWSTVAGEGKGQDKRLFRLSPKNDGNPRLSFKPGDRVHTGLVTGPDLNFAKASCSRIEDYRVDGQGQEVSIF